MIVLSWIETYWHQPDGKIKIFVDIVSIIGRF